eukprot:Lithocolla_globosa_v1_NODE_4130_length_1504_cov_17.396135.p1 type:complete len:483 gc:universal NODE_4130_length_1504_cov_17.396135:1466-18(-)
MATCDIAVVGLAVMGQNLILNMNDKGFVVGAYNRSVEKVDAFMQNEAKGTKIVPLRSIDEMILACKKPRKIMLMVKAGAAVDATMDLLIPKLEKGDILIDGGNTHFPDTIRREKRCSEHGLHFVGSGVSGGEEGARHGPSIMPGGTKEAWEHVKPIFQAISAKVAGEPCCDYVGENGAGHYVKMVHNGIEYGDMQIICEAYQIMKECLGMSCDEMAATFAEWNKTELDSYLVEITAEILAFKDKDGENLVEKIRDTAGQKGTGKWTGIDALDLGIPLTLVSESVFARCLSALKDERVNASKILKGPTNTTWEGDKKANIEHIRKALYASKIISYAQGFMLLREAAREYKWNLNYGGIALMWRGGCIIRSAFLGEIKKAYDADPNLSNLLLHPFFNKAVDDCQASWRTTVAKSIELGVPTPTFSTALAFYDGYRSSRLPANLLQAQRDYFGAHTYELLANPGTFQHTDWTGRGGSASSSTYNV